MARLSRYSRWDGTQALPDLDADQFPSAMPDDLLADGDLWNALRRLFHRPSCDSRRDRPNCRAILGLYEAVAADSPLKGQEIAK